MYENVRTDNMRFEWDEAKNIANQRKHDIDFETARWLAVGALDRVVIVVVDHTYRQDGPEERIRLISARHATTHERKLYAEANRFETKKTRGPRKLAGRPN
jgi:uncharacterized DUF497 family protein